MKWKEDPGGESFTAHGSLAVGGLYRVSWDATRHPPSPDKATTYYLYWRERGVQNARLIGHGWSLAEAKQRAEEHHARLRAVVEATFSNVSKTSWPA